MAKKKKGKKGKGKKGAKVVRPQPETTHTIEREVRSPWAWP